MSLSLLVAVLVAVLVMMMFVYRHCNQNRQFVESSFRMTPLPPPPPLKKKTPTTKWKDDNELLKRSVTGCQQHPPMETAVRTLKGRDAMAPWWRGRGVINKLALISCCCKNDGIISIRLRMMVSSIESIESILLGSYDMSLVTTDGKNQ